MQFENFVNTQYENIAGVSVINSGKPGKTIGILAITHGNETVGLKIFDFLQHELSLQHQIQGGKIFLIAMNLLAYKHQQRFIDHNMNRISNKPFENKSYEFERLKTLQPLLQKMDIVIDIHSFSNSNDHVIICDTSHQSLCKNTFQSETILVDELEKSGSIIGYCHRNGCISYGIECGEHTDKIGYEYGKQEICNLLSYYKVIVGEHNSKHKKDPIIYKFKHPIQPSTQNFKFTKNFSGFTQLSAGETFAVDGNKKYINTLGENIYLGIPAKHPTPLDSAGFLFEKVQ